MKRSIRTAKGIRTSESEPCAGQHRYSLTDTTIGLELSRLQVVNDFILGHELWKGESSVPMGKYKGIHLERLYFPVQGFRFE